MEIAVKLKNKILEYVQGDESEDFEALALEVFNFQSSHNEVYKTFLKHLSIDPSTVKQLKYIPLLPIQFFKHKRIQTLSWNPEKVFKSSGTTNTELRSIHLVKDPKFYSKISLQSFKKSISINPDYILTLLPSYLENNESSLVYMVQNIVKNYNPSLEIKAFYLDDFKGLHEMINDLCAQHKVLLIGVTFALLDFGNLYPVKSENLHLMFTGGMKNRRAELTYGEVYDQLKSFFPSSIISSEYGMTEMFSQAYCIEDREGRYKPVKTLRMMSYQITDPLVRQDYGRTGQMGFIDIANIDTLSFVMTQDLGISYKDNSFEILGRLSKADIRGCNLLYYN